MDPNDVRRFAEWAAQSAVSNDPRLTEVWLRMAVGRAYYSAFLQAREYLRHKHGNPTMFARSANVHAAVLALLRGNNSTQDERDAADELEGLRDRRRRADYDLRAPQIRWDNEATDSVAEAAQVFQLLP